MNTRVDNCIFSSECCIVFYRNAMISIQCQWYGLFWLSACCSVLRTSCSCHLFQLCQILHCSVWRWRLLSESLVKETGLSHQFLNSTSVTILGEGDGLLKAISGLCQCVSSHWLGLRKNPWWRRRSSWSIFRNRSLCVCSALALWQDNTELLLAVPEYAWFWLDEAWDLIKR